MTLALVAERNERQAGTHAPYLSHSRINRYLHCPEQYRLYYVEHLRRRVPTANLVFGQIVHQSLAACFEHGRDPVDAFTQTWTAMREADLEYSARDSWQTLFDAGSAVLARFVTEELPRIEQPDAVEKKFELQVTGLDLPFVGVIDLVARLDAVRTVIDFKTAGACYQPYEVVLSDQLTAYRLAAPAIPQAALCVFVKTRTPQIEWHITTRTGVELAEYLAKVQLVARAIDAGDFYRRPGKWCSWCDYLPVCLHDQAQVDATLVAIE
jgi:hypothetical protein